MQSSPISMPEELAVAKNIVYVPNQVGLAAKFHENTPIPYIVALHLKDSALQILRGITSHTQSIFSPMQSENFHALRTFLPTRAYPLDTLNDNVSTLELILNKNYPNVLTGSKELLATVKKNQPWKEKMKELERRSIEGGITVLTERELTSPELVVLEQVGAIKKYFTIMETTFGSRRQIIINPATMNDVLTTDLTPRIQF